MSESEYRDAREAARARVAVLEAELRDHDASATPVRDAPTSNLAEEKRQLRDRLGRIAKDRGIFRLIAALIFLGVARNSLFHGGSAGGIVAFVVFAAILLTILFRRPKPRGEELALERRLREIVKIEDDEYARFRVETSSTQKRMDAETEERARIEAELDDARTLAEGQEKKS